ncbi:MAG: hypothetical protein LBC29_06750, partial [Propionibacteriaceae bacterium]|nr:hypothetical protein [Propionibacteriaceae bacterium]
MISKRGFDPADDETPEPESQSQTPRRLASSAETDPSPVPDPIWYGDTPLTFAPAAATADTDAVTEVDTDATPDADTEPDADLEPDTDTTPDIDVTPDTDTDTETEPETDTPAPEADTPTPETTPRKPTISKGSIAAKVAGLLLAIAASASVVWLALAAHRSDMLPERYFWFAVGGSVAVVLALGVGLVMVRPHRRRVGYALLMCAAALVTAGSLFLANVFANVKHFTDGISGGIQSVTLTYVIIAPLPAGLTNPDATDLPPATGTSPSPGASPATPSATPTKPT